MIPSGRKGIPARSIRLSQTPPASPPHGAAIWFENAPWLALVEITLDGKHTPLLLGGALQTCFPSF